MNNNFPSENRGLNQNYPPGPQQMQNFQPVGVQINQQSFQPQQGFPPQGYPVQQGIPPQQVYAQPVIISPPNINSIVVNQPIVNKNIVFGRSPFETVCPRCGGNIITVVEDRCNGAAWGFCCIAFCFYACYQSYRGKDLGCSDTQHTCPICKQIIGAYIAM